MILDVLKSLDVPLSDSDMTETCSRQTAACSRQVCSSSYQLIQLNFQMLFCSYIINSKLTLIILSVLESLDVSLFDSVIIKTCSRHNRL